MKREGAMNSIITPTFKKKIKMRIEKKFEQNT